MKNQVLEVQDISLENITNTRIKSAKIILEASNSERDSLSFSVTLS
jgi:hypothetical protein